MRDLEEAIYHLRRGILRSTRSVQGVKLAVEFPSLRQAIEFEQHLIHNAHPEQRWLFHNLARPDELRTFTTTGLDVNGINVRLAWPRKDD